MRTPPPSSAHPPAAARLLAALGWIERGLALAAFALMGCVVLADVVMRELAGAGIPGARELAVHAMVLLVLAAFGIATATRSHLRPRFADRWLPRSWERWMPRVADALAALALLALAILAAGMVATTAALAERSPVLGVPLWPLQSALPLALAISSLRHAAYARWPALAPAESGAAA